MKISELIHRLQIIKEHSGDIECYISKYDGENNRSDLIGIDKFNLPEALYKCGTLPVEIALYRYAKKNNEEEMFASGEEGYIVCCVN